MGSLCAQGKQKKKIPQLFMLPDFHLVLNPRFRISKPFLSFFKSHKSLFTHHHLLFFTVSFGKVFPSIISDFTMVSLIS